MQIECKTYNLADLKKTLQISKRQWEERKEEVLQHMKFFFNYEITFKGRSYQFHITEQYCDYVPLGKKKDVAEMTAFYEQETDHIIQYKPRNSGSNIAREIVYHNNKYNHAEGTVANYIRPYLKAAYYIDDKQWCEIDYYNCLYSPISEEQEKYLKKQFQKYLSSADTADIIGEVEAGYIDKDDAYKKLKKNYDSAMQAFYQEFGFRPYKAGLLKEKAWRDERPGED